MHWLASEIVPLNPLGQLHDRACRYHTVQYLREPLDVNEDKARLPSQCKRIGLYTGHFDTSDCYQDRRPYSPVGKNTFRPEKQLDPFEQMFKLKDGPRR